MNNLIYEKYKGTDNILIINLHNGYTIIAIKSWNKEKCIYNVELRLKENTTDKWDLIEKAGNLEFKTNYRHINPAILKQVSTYFQNGFFDYYIHRADYEADCFDKGNELLENEKPGKLPGYQDILRFFDKKHYKLKVKNNLYTILAKIDNGIYVPVLKNCYIKASEIKTLPDIINSKVNVIKNKEYIKAFVKSMDYQLFISSIQNYKNSGCKVNTLFKENLDRLEMPGLYISLWLYGKCIYNRILDIDINSLINIKKECLKKLINFLTATILPQTWFQRLIIVKTSSGKQNYYLIVMDSPELKLTRHI